MINMVIPTQAGFYYESGVPCKYADSKQVSADKYILQHDLCYRAKDGTLYVVNTGFEHDGASKGFLKRFGDYTNAAILHDALYGSELESRGKADRVFLEAMKHSGVPWYQRYTYYSAVAAAGWLVWSKHTDKSVKIGRLYIRKFQGV